MTKIGACGLILIAVLAVAVWALPRSAQAQGCGGSPVGRCLDDIGMDPTQFMRGLESFFPQAISTPYPGGSKTRATAARSAVCCAITRAGLPIFCEGSIGFRSG